MPRRFLATRQKVVSAVEDRLRAALVYEIQRPSKRIIIIINIFVYANIPLPYIAQNFCQSKVFVRQKFRQVHHHLDEDDRLVLYSAWIIAE